MKPKPKTLVKLTEEQIAKVFENVGKIVEYIHGIQPDIVCQVDCSWGYDQYGMTVTRNTIVGSSPTHRIIAIEPSTNTLGTSVPLSEDLDFAISLVAWWHENVKEDLKNRALDNYWALKAIEDFEA